MALTKATQNVISPNICTTDTTQTITGTKTINTAIVTSTGSTTSRTLANRFADVINVKDFGAVGDGIADDYQAIVDAATVASSTGASLLFDGSKTYLFGLSLGTEQIIFPANLKIQTNGSTFVAAYNTISNNYAIQIQGNSFVDELNVTIPTGVRRDRSVCATGSNISIEKITVTSVDLQATAENNDAGVTIKTGSIIDIGTINVTNYNRAVIIENTISSRISAINITNYLRGIWMFDNIDLTIGQTSIKTRSPAASSIAGHNGILMSCNTTNAQRNVTINNAVVEDSGEHGIRVGGDAQQINITFNNPKVYNAGNCGIKLLGTDTTAPTSKNRNIIINSPIIEDCGTSASAGTNRAGILIEHVIGCQVIAPIIKTRSNATSVVYGISINASSFVNITNPIIEKAQLDGILIDNRTVSSNNEHITVDGGQIVDCGQDGIRVLTQDTFSNNYVIFNGTNLVSNTNFGFSNTVVGSGNPTQIVFKVQTQSNTAGMGSSNTIRTTLQGIGVVGATPLAGISAANGSSWNDGVTLNIRKAAVWVAL